MWENPRSEKTQNPIELKAEVDSKNEVTSMRKNPKNNNPQIKANTELPYLTSRRQ